MISFIFPCFSFTISHGPAPRSPVPPFFFSFSVLLLLYCYLDYVKLSLEKNLIVSALIICQRIKRNECLLVAHDSAKDNTNASLTLMPK